MKLLKQLLQGIRDFFTKPVKQSPPKKSQAKPKAKKNARA